jgi:hypothetical protein
MNLTNNLSTIYNNASFDNSTETSNNNGDLINEIQFITTFIGLPIKIFGIITNIINTYIFSRNDFKDGIFVYFYIHSLSEVIYIAADCINIFANCGRSCSPNIRESYFAKWLSLYNDDYFTACLAIYAIFLEITICLHRYLTIINSSFCSVIKKKSPFLVSAVLFVMSLIYYLPVVIFNKIVNIEGTPYYDVVDSQIAENNQTLTFYYGVIINLFRGPIFMTVLAIINLLTLKKFRKQMKKKKSMLTQTNTMINGKKN